MAQAEKDLYEWEPRYAFFPTKVGTRRDGKPHWVWFETYGHRILPNGVFETQTRPLEAAQFGIEPLTSRHVPSLL
ncbi:MAG: hypothetical protein ABA06_00230 [Parcubacteria bacterium C7867-001]|nr:MAG: hypothetical protein ABA06_00230 [Parcubacteria bacterium C7867-001]